MAKKTDLIARRKAPLATPTNLSATQSKNLSAALNALLADVFALYLKTKNFHWHISGPFFRSYHLLLDEQAAELLAITDVLAESVRKSGGTTLRSIGHISRLQRIADNDADFVTADDMLSELIDDNRALALRLQEVHGLADEAGHVSVVGLLEDAIDAAEKRVWFLFESTRK